MTTKRRTKGGRTRKRTLSRSTPKHCSFCSFSIRSCSLGIAFYCVLCVFVMRSCSVLYSVRADAPVTDYRFPFSADAGAGAGPERGERDRTGSATRAQGGTKDPAGTHQGQGRRRGRERAAPITCRISTSNAQAARPGPCAAAPRPTERRTHHANRTDHRTARIEQKKSFVKPDALCAAD